MCDVSLLLENNIPIATREWRKVLKIFWRKTKRRQKQPLAIRTQTELKQKTVCTSGATKFVSNPQSLQVTSVNNLTLILLTWSIGWALNNASKWQMGFKSAFKGLKDEFRKETISGTFPLLCNYLLLGPFVTLGKTTVRFVISVIPHVTAPAGRILINFSIWIFFGNRSRNLKFC
jgi:hypothetical protein